MILRNTLCIQNKFLSLQKSEHFRSANTIDSQCLAGSIQIIDACFKKKTMIYDN